MRARRDQEPLRPNVTKEPSLCYTNRPFIYFIRDSFGSICFAGVYRGGK